MYPRVNRDAPIIQSEECVHETGGGFLHRGQYANRRNALASRLCRKGSLEPVAGNAWTSHGGTGRQPPSIATRRRPAQGHAGGFAHKNGQHYKKCLQESLELQKRLRQLTHRVLDGAGEHQPGVLAQLHDEIAQTLLGINVRQLSLKQEARVIHRSQRHRWHAVAGREIRLIWPSCTSKILVAGSAATGCWGQRSALIKQAGIFSRLPSPPSKRPTAAREATVQPVRNSSRR